MYNISKTSSSKLEFVEKGIDELNLSEKLRLLQYLAPQAPKKDESDQAGAPGKDSRKSVRMVGERVEAAARI